MSRRIEADAERSARAPSSAPGPRRDRSRLARGWYGLVRTLTLPLFAAPGGLRATGRGNVPVSGGALLVSNHLSHLDVFVLGLALPRPLNYVARSSLFFPPLGALIRSVGGFPIQRDGMGAQGLKETLRRLRDGGMVLLFPEGTRSRDGALGELKSGIAVLATRAKVPIVPAGLVGTFEAWPRHRLLPRPHPICIHFGPPILPEELAGLDAEQTTALIRARLLDCRGEAGRSLSRIVGPRAVD